jgi:acetoacetyl-CoA synthetase
VNNCAQFWDAAFKNIDLIHAGSYSKVVDESARIDLVPHWFEGINLNFAENILYSHKRGTESGKRSTQRKEDSKIALVEVREGGTEIRHITWKDFCKDIAQLASAMKAYGIKKGDCVAIVASNSYDTLRVFMAATSLGAIFSSSSTDMGTKGVLQRTLQIEPKYIFMDDFAIYNGKRVDLREKMAEIAKGMQDVKEFKGIVSMPRFEQPADISKIPRSILLKEYEAKATSSELQFEKLAFRDPFLICYSSGTTGKT